MFFTFIFVLANTNFQTLMETFNFVNLNFEVDSTILNNINTLQIMIVTNKTDNDVYKYFFDKESKHGFLREEINIYFQKVSSLMGNRFYKLRENELKARDVSLISCKNIYNIFDIDMINKVINKYKKDDLIRSLTTICSSFSYMNTDNNNFLFEEMIYKTQYILNKHEFSKGDYAKLKDANDDSELFALYLFVLIIVRPINKYLEYEVVKEIVENSFSGVLRFNILSVILNILIDFILLLLVYRSIVKMLRIISYFKNLENSLNFK